MRLPRARCVVSIFKKSTKKWLSVVSLSLWAVEKPGASEVEVDRNGAA